MAEAAATLDVFSGGHLEALEAAVLGRQDRAPHRGPKGVEGLRAPDAHPASTDSRDERQERSASPYGSVGTG